MTPGATDCDSEAPWSTRGSYLKTQRACAVGWEWRGRTQEAAGSDAVATMTHGASVRGALLQRCPPRGRLYLAHGDPGVVRPARALRGPRSGCLRCVVPARENLTEECIAIGLVFKHTHHKRRSPGVID